MKKILFGMFSAVLAASAMATAAFADEYVTDQNGSYVAAANPGVLIEEEGRKEDYSGYLSINDQNYSLFIDGDTLVIPREYGGNVIDTVNMALYNYQNDYSAISYIYIPETIKSITCYTNGLYNLQEYIVDKNSKYFKSVDGVLYDADGYQLIIYPYGKKDESYDVIDGCIGVDALFDNSHLKEINLPSSLTSISEMSFVNAFNLEKINVASGNRIYKSVDGVVITKDGKYLVKLPRGKTGDYTIPNTVTTLISGSIKFPSLTTLTIPTSVTKIYESALQNSVKNIIVSSGNKYFKVANDVLLSMDGTRILACPQTKSDTSYTIPDGVTTIDSCAFFSCDNLTKVYIPASVTYIGNQAFDYSPITDVYYSGSESDWNNIQGGTYSNFGLGAATIHYNGTGSSAPTIASPSISSAKVSGTSVTLTWNAVPGASSYRIYRSESATGTKTMLKAVTTTSYTDTTATAGKTYYYFVASYSSSLKELSNYSASKTVTIPAAPAAPKNVKALSGGGNVTITWDAVKGATSYRIFRSDSLSGTRKQIKIRTSTYYIDTEVDTGKTYYYWVVAYNANTGMKSGYSANSSVKVVDAFATSIEIKSASVLSTSVTLKWDMIPGATSYRIYRRNDDGTRKLLYAQSMTEYKDTGLTKGKAYTYEIRGYSKSTGALTAYSPKKTVRPMAAPTILTGNVKGKITWDKNAVATSYRVYRADSLTGAKKLLKPVTTTYYTDTTAESGKQYYYFVAAYDNTTGTLSAYSNAKAIKIS